MNEFYALIIGLLLRIGIPILFTGGLIYLLSRIDARWQEEAMRQQGPVLETGQKPRWLQEDCSPEEKLARLAVKSTEPCWQVFRQGNGYLAQKCLDCQVFTSALAPAQS